MPARMGDTRTPAQKEEDSKKKVYNLLTEEYQSWGTLKKAAKTQHLSPATLSKHLKRFVETGIALKIEEEVEERRLPRTFYRLTSRKPWLSGISERDFFVAAKKMPLSIPSEEENRVLVRMEAAVRIFSYQIAGFLTLASEISSLEEAMNYMDSMLDITLKDRIRDLTRIFYKYRKVGNESAPISASVQESLIIEAENSVQCWLAEDLDEELEKSLKNLEAYLPDPKSTMAWIILTSESKQAMLNRVRDEVDSVESILRTP